MPRVKKKDPSIKDGSTTDGSTTDDQIRQAICACLSRVKNDEVYMSHELDAKDFDDIKLGEGKSKKIHRFFELVANTLDVTRKKKVKEFIAERLQGQDYVKQEIASFDPINPSESINATNVVSPQIMDIDVDKNNATKKRPRSSTGQKIKPQNSKRRRSSNSISFSKKERQEFAAEAKSDFEAAKQKILDGLDSSYKELFGKIAFCKWKKDPYRPVLILSPYSVPPALRETWLTMWKNTKGDPKRMWYYTFWYGSPLEEGYTQSKRKELILYDEGEKRGLHQLDEKVQRKLDNGKKLSKAEEQAVKGYEQLESELAKQPSQRYSETFQELHASILNLEDTVSLPDEEGAESMDSSDENDQDDNEFSDSDDSELEEASSIDTKTTKKGKKPASGEKKRKQKKETIDAEAAKQRKTSTAGKKKGRQKKEGTKARGRGRESTIKEESSDESGRAEALEKQDIAGNESEDEGGKRKKTIARKRVSKKMSKGNKTMEEEEAEELKLLKDDRNIKKEENLELKRKRNQEWEAYTVCREIFQTLTDELQEAIRKRDGERCVKLIKEIKNKDVSKLTAPFMEETKLPVLLKKSKPVICDERDKNVRKDLYEALKNVYADKKDHVPDGWRKSEPKQSSNRREKETTGNDHKVGKGETLKNTSNNGTIIDSFHNESKLDDSTIQPELQQEPDRAQSIETNALIDSRKTSNTTKIEPSLVTSAVPNSKIVKKKPPLTSLRSLLAKDSKPKEKTQEDLHEQKFSSFDEAIVKKLPEWLTTNTSEDTSFERDDFRKLGLEFFDQVSEIFPETIKSTTVADALECALYTWATDKESEPKWKEIYRERLHKIVGALTGKHKPGLLIEEIVRGKYQSAMEMMKETDDVLLASFEGNEGFFQN
mmetsp:Transcript_8994/g.13982  ORF Transcript_8994/g.13982 Transcript_8994/m.13982 type:complete len:886 (+) Transcript_8994:116-2773(+)